MSKLAPTLFAWVQEDDKRRVLVRRLAAEFGLEGRTYLTACTSLTHSGLTVSDVQELTAQL